jgi:hypothetical protein
MRCQPEGAVEPLGEHAFGFRVFYTIFCFKQARFRFSFPSRPPPARQLPWGCAKDTRVRVELLELEGY